MSNALPGSPATSVRVPSPKSEVSNQSPQHRGPLGPQTGRALARTPVYLERLLCWGPHCSPTSDRSCLGSCLTSSPASPGREQVPGGSAGSPAASGTGTVWFCPSQPACS